VLKKLFKATATKQLFTQTKLMLYANLLGYRLKNAIAPLLPADSVDSMAANQKLENVLLQLDNPLMSIFVYAVAWKILIENAFIASMLMVPAVFSANLSSQSAR